MAVITSPEREQLLPDFGRAMIKDRYGREGEGSVQERFAFVAESFADDEAHAQRLYDYFSQGWFVPATPVLSYGRDAKGLPISCYLVHQDDSAEGLVDAQREVAQLSMRGGGVGIGIGIRSPDDKSTGIINHLGVYGAMTSAYRQAKTRRSAYAAYLPISHPEVVPFTELRKPTGDLNRRVLSIHHGLVVPDEFMELIAQKELDADFDDAWGLKDPNSEIVKDTIPASKLWELMLRTRLQTGEPYIMFRDNCERARPFWQRHLGPLTMSNLCTEILEFVDKLRTAICALGSFNAVHFHLWRHCPGFVEDIARFMDNVLQCFIDRAEGVPGLERARFSATRERSLGLGLLGWHSMLQSRGVAFCSFEARNLTRVLHGHLKEEMAKADAVLCAERGACPDAGEQGVERRFTHHFAIAPNASTSDIWGVSPSREPMAANIFRKDTLSGASVFKNPYLEITLRDRGLDTQAVWDSIVENDGSVQHLDLDPEVKQVFLTAREINQIELIKMACVAQEYVDQGISTNVFFPAEPTVQYLHEVHMAAWRGGLKTLYYLRSDKAARAEGVSTSVERVDIQINEPASDGCIMCEG